nr:hypothetical protein CFP56_65893 [Quercus suber]
MIPETDSEADYSFDSTEVSIYPGHDIWDRKDEADIDCNDMAVTAARIRCSYDAGLPFFTKESLQSLQCQLTKAVQSSEKLHVRGLDGILVEFQNETGRTFPAGHPHLERVL